MIDIQGLDVGVGGAVALVVLAVLQCGVLVLYSHHIRALRQIVDNEREATRLALKHMQWVAADCDIHRREASETRIELATVRKMHDWIMDTHPTVYERWVIHRLSEGAASERRDAGFNQQ